MSTLTAFIQHCTGGPCQHKKKKKKDTDGKEEIKLPLVAGDITFCVKKPKKATKRLLELVREFSEVIG